jgi:hypothetical protein
LSLNNFLKKLIFKIEQILKIFLDKIFIFFWTEIFTFFLTKILSFFEQNFSLFFGQKYYLFLNRIFYLFFGQNFYLFLDRTFFLFFGQNFYLFLNRNFYRLFDFFSRGKKKRKKRALVCGNLGYFYFYFTLGSALIFFWYKKIRCWFFSSKGFPYDILFYFVKKMLKKHVSQLVSPTKIKKSEY